MVVPAVLLSTVKSDDMAEVNISQSLERLPINCLTIKDNTLCLDGLRRCKSSDSSLQLS